MPAPTITPLPAPPTRGENKADFAAKSNAFVAALPTFQSEANAQAAFNDTRAGDAENAATAAAASATSASDSLDQTIATSALYTERHQGAHPSAPATRNDGSPLQPGDFYWDTTANQLYTWTGA